MQLHSALIEQRRSPRVKTDAVVEFFHAATGVVAAKARDLSDGGIFVAAGSYPLPPIGTLLEVRIKRHTGAINQQPVAMRVIHRNHDGMGLAFV